MINMSMLRVEFWTIKQSNVCTKENKKQQQRNFRTKNVVKRSEWMREEKAEGIFP